ncbi:uncharacterized, partial [Tachysurus ichikawai]
MAAISERSYDHRRELETKEEVPSTLRNTESHTAQ